MNTATLEVPAQYAAEFQQWLLDEVTNAGRELPWLKEQAAKGRYVDEAESENRTLIDGAALLAQVEDWTEGEPARYEGSARELSSTLDGLLNGTADQLDSICGTSPAEYDEIPPILEKIRWLAEEAKRVDAIDREKAVA